MRSISELKNDRAEVLKRYENKKFIYIPVQINSYILYKVVLWQRNRVIPLLEYYFGHPCLIIKTLK